MPSQQNKVFEYERILIGKNSGTAMMLPRPSYEHNIRKSGFFFIEKAFLT
jgi:hypothetical protein